MILVIVKSKLVSSVYTCHYAQFDSCSELVIRSCKACPKLHCQHLLDSIAQQIVLLAVGCLSSMPDFTDSAEVSIHAQAIVRGKAIHLSGRPRDYPEMEEDSLEVIINGGMIFLFAFGVPQVLHEDNAPAVIQDLMNSDLQVGQMTASADLHD